MGKVADFGAHHGGASPPAVGTREDHATDACVTLPECTPRSERRFSTSCLLLGIRVNRGKRKGRNCSSGPSHIRGSLAEQRLPVELAPYGPVGEPVVVHIDVEGPGMLP